MRPADGFIALFVLSQVLLPLRWYVGGADTADTRFAWRMFSRSDAVDCQGGFVRGGQPVELGEHLVKAWADDVHQGRAVVIQAVARHLCEGGGSVRLELECLMSPGEVVQVGDPGVDLCRR